MSSASTKKASVYKNDNPTDELVKVKHRGKIYTPDYLVKNILDFGNYVSGNINKKHVIDNSCGDGQFMIHVIDRYCSDFLRSNNNKDELKKELETFIHAIEIDTDEFNTCKTRCDEVARNYGIEDVRWDFHNENALTCNLFDNKMDFVVGNPPYVRVHNLAETRDDVKKYRFNSGGMTDLYITFFEISINMLNSDGVVTYITPSSFFTSLAGCEMRKCLIQDKLICKICDLKHFQPFNATTYTVITLLKKNNNDSKINYYEYNVDALEPKNICNLRYKDFYIDGNYYFASKQSLEQLKAIHNNSSSTDISIKNGFATLADKVFVHDFDFESDFIIPVLKASCAKWTKIFYPYDKDGNFISEEVISHDKNIYDYLLSNKEALLKRSSEKKDIDGYWYAFGRSQGIRDTQKEKLSVGTLIKKPGEIKITNVPAGCGVYSGFYVYSDTYSNAQIEEALRSENFFNYVSLLGKYKSGGYYTFSSKDIKRFLDNYFSKKESTK